MSGLGSVPGGMPSAAVLDAIQDPIAVADADGKVRWANLAFRRRYADGIADVRGARIDTLLCGEEAAAAELGAAYVTYETSSFRVAGTFLVSQSPIDLEGGRGLLYQLCDVTALRAAERTARLGEARAHQAQKMEAVGRLAGGVAHDFNNLLTSVLCNVEILLERAAGEPALIEPLEQVEEAAQRGASLVRHLLSFGRPRPGRPELLRVDDRLRDLTKIIKSLIGEDIRLVLDLRSPEAVVRLDPVQLEQVILNLAVNAKDAMDAGGVLTVASERLLGQDGNTWLALTVSDSGSGMDAATLARAMEPFFTTKPEGQGSGLGLATVYAIVQAAGGEIGIESEVGHGTRVRIKLPASGGEEAGAALAGRKAEMARGDRSQTVLLVEDEEGPRWAIGEALRELGFEVLAAADARGALDLARSHPGDIALLLADVVMPGASGPELARDIRIAYPRTRVLLMSGYGSDARRERGLFAPSDLPLLPKPFSLHDLAASLQQVLS